MIIFTLLLSSIIIFRCIILQKCNIAWKIAASVFAILIAGKFYLLRVFGGSSSLFNPELPAWILLPFAWLFAWLMFFCVWLIIYDLASLTTKLFCRWKKRRLPQFCQKPLWRVYGLIPAAILVSIGIYEGTKLPVVTERTIIVKNLPEKFDGLRIVHLTDIHADPLNGEEKIRQIVDMTNAQNADLIVITGDFVDGRASVRGKDLAVLQELYAPFGVYGVPGNHEYYSGYREWITLLETYGVDILENQHVMPGENFALGGVTDPAASRMKGQGEFELPNVQKAFAGVPDGSFRLLLAHQPKVAVDAAENNVDLQLSGHTHGGMIWGMDLLVAAFNNGWYSGEYEVGNTKLYISNGTGIWGGFPIRLGHRSEIVVITLKRQ